MQYIEFPQPPTLNQQLNTARTNRYQAASVKKTWTNKIARLAEDLQPYTCPIWAAIEITYSRTNCDQDNLYSCQKFIWDGLVQAEIIPGDTVKYIQTPIIYSYCKHTEKLVKLWLFDNKEEHSQHAIAIINQ